MARRIQSLQEFFPYYLGEHRSATSRRLHFLGTSGFLTASAASAALNPLGFGAGLTAMCLLAWHGLKAEKKALSLPHVIGMVAAPSLASPALFPAGVLCAYGCAWLGHFRFEGNKPATFQYPIMSLVSDFRMYGQMLRGRLWKGDPLVELGLESPGPGEATRPDDAPARG